MKTAVNLLFGLVIAFVIVSLMVVRVSAEDSMGNNGNYAITTDSRVEKPSQVAPVIDDLSASSEIVEAGKTITLTVQAHDPDCPDVCYSGCGMYIRYDLTQWNSTDGSFSSIDNGTSGSPYVATAEWQAPATDGTYDISVYLGDSGSFLCGGRETTTDGISIQVVTPSAIEVQSVSSGSHGAFVLYIWFGLPVTGGLLFWFVKHKSQKIVTH